MLTTQLTSSYVIISNRCHLSSGRLYDNYLSSTFTQRHNKYYYHFVPGKKPKFEKPQLLADVS